MADLLGEDLGLAEIHKLYRCHDRLLEHKQALFDHLVGRWRDLFNISFDVLLYDLTSTYFEADPPFAESDKRRHGYSRDHRPDCVQVVIALVVTPEGLPLAYEVLPGNTADNTTLRDFLARIERQYGKARRIWLMDRGIPTEVVLAEMRGGQSPGPIPRRHAQGPPDPIGEGPPREALAAGPAGGPGQALAARRRTLCFRRQRQPRRQGAGNAATTAEMVVGAPQAALNDGAQPRGIADEARRCPSPCPSRVAPGRHRGSA